MDSEEPSEPGTPPSSGAAVTAAAEARGNGPTRRTLVLGLGGAALLGLGSYVWRKPSGASEGALGLRPLGDVRVPWPARQADALPGRQFGRAIRTFGGFERDQAILRELEAGNVPDFLRRFVPLVLERSPSAPDAGSQAPAVKLLLWVLSDYLAVGTDDDFMRVPMMPSTAQRIADRLGCALPTRALVDTIYDHAEVKLDPEALETGPDMVTSEDFVKHSAVVDEQQKTRGAHRSALTAGHMKDIVVSARLATRPGHVAIYGLHQRDKTPIQTLSLLHQSFYVDYMHGVRLVADHVLVDDEPCRIADLLADPDRCGLLSDEGPIGTARYPIEP